MTVPEVCVVGAGPAGLALATALAKRGVTVDLLDPAPHQPWAPTYGVWEDDVAAKHVARAIDHRWRHAAVHTDTGTHLLERPYLRLHTGRLHAQAIQDALDAGVVLQPSRVLALGAHTRRSQPIFTSVGTRHARLVVDATGRGLPETHALRPASVGPGVQVAYGQRITVDQHPWATDTLTLMDWRRLRDVGPHAGDTEQHPTFLYALPFSETEVFVEETVLSTRPARPIAECEARLQARLRQLGVGVREVHETERCFIPMGGPLPVLERSERALLPFGAAAGLVHPATGYSLATSLRLAPVVADTLVEALSVTDGRGAARAAWQTIWPLEARRNRALYQYGLDLLVDLPLHAMQRFYDAFFSADGARPSEDQLWKGYMADRLSTAKVATLMARVFAAADPHTRLKLMRGGPESDHMALGRALLGI